MLILGVLAMHVLLTTPQGPSPMPSVSVATQVHGAIDVPESGEPRAVDGLRESSMADDCGDLLAACLALLLTIAGLLRWRRNRTRRVLWLRPHPTLVRIGALRAPLDRLTPLERTTVLRC